MLHLLQKKERILLFEGWLTDTWLIIANVLLLLISLVILDKASHIIIINTHLTEHEFKFINN